MMNRTAAANAALVFGSTVLALLVILAAGEFVLRLQYGALPTHSPREMRTYDERRGWALRPGRYEYFDVKAVRRVSVAINELGLRSAPIAPRPASGVERITVLGDSFIFGAPVNADATITARLQALAGSAYEIVNVGVPGYGTGQQYLLVEELRAKGYDLGRKLVLAFFTNDLQDNLGIEYSSLRRYHAQPAFSVDAAGNLQYSATQAPRPGAAGEAASGFERSLFLQFLRYQAEVLLVAYPHLYGAAEALGMVPRLPRTPGIIAGWYDSEWEARWKASDALLEHVVTRLRATEKPPEIFVAFVPSPFQVHEAFRRSLAAGAERDARYASFLADPDRPQRVLQALARRLEVPFIDLTQAMRGAAQNSLVYFVREGHFNELGCAIAARVLFEHVIQKAH
jgi:hypothetical protein